MKLDRSHPVEFNSSNNVALSILAVPAGITYRFATYSHLICVCSLNALKAESLCIRVLSPVNVFPS